MSKKTSGGHARKKKKQALALLSSNHLAEAASLFEQVCQTAPGDVESWIYLVKIYARLNQPAHVERCCRAIISLLPDSDDAYYNLGCALMMQQQHTVAIDAFRQAVHLNPGHAMALFHLGKLLHLLNDTDEALACYREASRLLPALAEAHSGIGDILENQGQIPMAMDAYRKALRINPGLIEANIGLGLVLAHLGEFEKAQQHAERAIQTDSNNEDAIALAANIANRTGDTETALKLLHPFIKAGSNHINIAIAFSGACREHGCTDEAIAMMERILASSQPLSLASQFSLHFELGKCYDRQGSYEKAFPHYRQGNELKPASFDLQLHNREIEAIITTCSPEFMASAPRASIHSDRPLFVVGMVRSGTSLVEQILASHATVHGAGELPDIIRMALSLQNTLGSKQHYPQCLSELTQDMIDTLTRNYLDHLQQIAPNATRVVDKMPGNFAHLGLIELLFPDARIIHCKRDPVDTCLSAYFQDFSQSHPYSYNLTSLGAVYNQYLKIMEHWKKVLQIPVLEVQYEELVSDQEGVSRRLVEFCGLEWDDHCLQFHKTRRHVATASYDQVRRPLYTQSAGRWKHYEKFLDPLLNALNRN